MPIGNFLVPYVRTDEGAHVTRKLAISDVKLSGYWSERELDDDFAIVRARASEAEIKDLATSFERVDDSVAALKRDVLDDQSWGELQREAEILAVKADEQGYVRISHEWPDAARLLVVLGNAGYGLDRVSTGTFPTTSVLETFTGADNASSIGANWTADLIASSWASHGITSNTGYAAASFKSNYYSAASYGNDQEVFATVSTASTSGSSGICLRITGAGTSGVTMYEARWSNTDTFVLRWDSNSGGTQLGSNLFNTLASGDKFGLEAISGTLTAYRNTGSGWSAIGARDGSTYTTGTRLGWITSSSTTTRIDDFGGGTITSAATHYGMLMGVG